MTKINCDYEVRYLNPNSTLGTFSESFDPAGDLPESMLELINTDLPYIFITNLRAEILKKRAQNKTPSNSIQAEIEKLVSSRRKPG